MRYDCGHYGCDICGVRKCADSKPNINSVKGGYGDNKYQILYCDDCLRRCIRFSLEAAQTFGGTILDPVKPCGRVVRAVGGE